MIKTEENDMRSKIVVTYTVRRPKTATLCAQSALDAVSEIFTCALHHGLSCKIATTLKTHQQSSCSSSNHIKVEATSDRRNRTASLGGMRPRASASSGSHLFEESFYDPSHTSFMIKIDEESYCWSEKWMTHDISFPKPAHVHFN